MATVTAPSAKTIPAYPASAVAAALQEELVRVIRSRYRRKGQPLPKADDEVIVLVIELDSLTVVELLACLDDVKAGGYGSIAEAVKHVVGRVESKWIKYHSGGKA